MWLGNFRTPTFPNFSSFYPVLTTFYKMISLRYQFWWNGQVSIVTHWTVQAYLKWSQLIQIFALFFLSCYGSHSLRYHHSSSSIMHTNTGELLIISWLIVIWEDNIFLKRSILYIVISPYRTITFEIFSDMNCLYFAISRTHS